MRNIKKAGFGADGFVFFQDRRVVERNFPIAEKAELGSPRGVPGVDKKTPGGLC
jgi:hypothetical protein